MLRVTNVFINANKGGLKRRNASTHSMLASRHCSQPSITTSPKCRFNQVTKQSLPQQLQMGVAAPQWGDVLHVRQSRHADGLIRRTLETSLVSRQISADRSPEVPFSLVCTASKPHPTIYPSLCQDERTVFKMMHPPCLPLSSKGDTPSTSITHIPFEFTAPRKLTTAFLTCLHTVKCSA